MKAKQAHVGKAKKSLTAHLTPLEDTLKFPKPNKWVDLASGVLIGVTYVSFFAWMLWW